MVSSLNLILPTKGNETSTRSRYTSNEFNYKNIDVIVVVALLYQAR